MFENLYKLIFSFGRKRNDNLDCFSSNSSDSEEVGIGVGTEQVYVYRQSEMIANEAVSHSYEDITRPNYRNYLWLASQWDRTDLLSARYFLLNWADHFKTFSIADKVESAASSPIQKWILFYFFNGRKGGGIICNFFFNFVDKLGSLPDSFFPKRRIIAPKKLKTLILDLDETLIHSTATTTTNCSDFDFIVEVLVNRASCIYYVYKRPNLDYFLNVVSNWYNLVIYTASVKEYADPVVNLIDETGKFFKRRFFRSDCTKTPSAHYLKDISIVDGGDISKICLLDNSAASFAFYPDNAIPIESWKEDPNDSALLDLLPFLDALRFVDDVRSILSLRRLFLFCNK